MKTLKNLFRWAPTGLLPALIVALVAACTDTTVDEAPLAIQNQAPEAIQFGTYLNKQSTRAGSTTAQTTSQLQTDGFGVFAYFTENTDYTAGQTSYRPNFMYNTKVSTASWTYNPLKYWPNDFANTAVDNQTPDAATGSSTYGGKVSFFAYAPHVEGTVTLSATDYTFEPSSGRFKSSTDTYYDAQPEASGITQMTGNAATGDPTITYALSQTSFVDLLWGTAYSTNENVLGTAQTGTTLTGGLGPVNANLTKQKVSGKVGFQFKHALAKIGGSGNGSTTGFLVKLDIDDGTNATGGSREQYDKDGDSSNDTWRTIVTIKDITITNDLTGDDDADDSGSGEVGIGGTETLNLATGVWTKTGSTGLFKQTIAGPDATILLNSKIAENKTNSQTWFANLASPNVIDYFSFDQNVTHPGVTETAQSVYANDQSPIVLFPGTTPKFKITVDYIVRTYDAALSTKYTEVEQIISKELTFPTVEMNKHYSILMHLGLTGVKFTATVVDWDTDINDGGGTTIDDAEDVNLPINVTDAP